MRYPINGTIVVTGEYREKAQPGTGLPDASGTRRHIGVDLRAAVGTNVFAPGAGRVIGSYNTGAGQTLEVLIDGKIWRFMHLSARLKAVGASFGEGEIIARSGNSGGVKAHLHVDVRKNGTTWNASLNNFFDFRVVIQEANNKSQFSYLVGKQIRFLPRRSWKLYFPGTTTVRGTLNITDNTFQYLVRGIDAKYPNRVIINSGTVGAGSAAPLADVNGKVYSGEWVEVK